MTNRVTLKEVSRRAPGIMAKGDSLLLDEGAPPTLNDLAGALQFALGDGRIWLNDERMVMMQTNVLGDLRARMIHEIGMDRTRSNFMRVGWQQGVQLAELITKRFNQENITAALAAGPRLHTLEGFAKVVTRRFEFDAAKRQYLGEFYWHDSVEGTEHLRCFGECDCAVCWMQVAVPSGYTTTLLGYPVIFRELECMGQGAQRCLVIGKDANSWEDDVPELDLFGLKDTPKGKAAPWRPPVDVTIPIKPAERDRGDILGTSAAILRARRLIERVAAFSEPVMLIGEAGTGKEHFARFLHSRGQTPNGPFVPVNCSVYADAQEADNETLFGTDGLVAQASNGTIFLNDFISLPQGHQAKLALMLHGRAGRKPSCRIVAATGLHPMEAVTSGMLRADLQYLLSVLPVQVPPLRERRDDLPALIEHFVQLHSNRHKKAVDRLTGAVYDMLLRYDYPGNMRELSNLIERGVIYAEPGGMIDITHVFSVIENAPNLVQPMQRDGVTYRPKTVGEIHGERTLEEMEVAAVRAALMDADWNVSAAARKLGLTRAKLDYRMKKFGLTPEV